jgi:hypothetical protein
MTTPSSPPKTRNLIAAVLAGGLITSLSACGVTSTTASSPVSEAQPIAAATGSPLVQCGMAQLTPRVAAGDPVLSRGNDFFNQLEQAQQVPPAVQKVYTVDIPGLNDTQKHEVLLFLSSLNQCPGLSPDLQKSVLDAFDQLTPKSVADSDNGSDGVQSEVIRSDDSAYSDSDADSSWADGDWDGHPWWFRPAWDHPVTDHDDWVQWGTDRHEHVIWRWDGHDWQRFGRAQDAPANKPYLPTRLGTGAFNPPSHNQQDTTNNTPNNNTPNQVPGAPATNQNPTGVVPGSTNGSPDANAPQGVARPQFDNGRPGGPNGTTTNGTTHTNTSTTDNSNSNSTATNSTRTNSTGTGSSGTGSSNTRPDSTGTGSSSSNSSSDTGSTRTERGSSSSSDTGTGTHERQSSPRESSSGSTGTSSGAGSSSTGTGGGGPIRN